MKLVIQRVSDASVKVDGKIVGQIKKGFMVLFGVTHTDTPFWVLSPSIIRLMSLMR